MLSLLVAVPAQAAPIVLSIDDAVNRALAANPDIREAEQRRVAALHEAAAARTGNYPTVSADASAVHRARHDRMAINGATSQVGGVDGADLTGRVDQLIYDGGKTDAQIQQAGMATKAAYYSLKAVENLVRAGARERCYEILRFKALYEAAGADLKAALEHRKDAETRVRAGVSPGVEIIRADIRIKQAALVQVNRQNQLKIAVASLATLIGAPTESEIDVINLIPGPEQFKPVDDPEITALARRPELLALRSGAQADALAIKMQRAGYLPAFKAFGAWTWQDDDAMPAYDNWRVGIAGSWEIFNWGRTSSRVRSANARAQASADHVKSQEDQVKIEVRQALLSIRAALESIQLADAQARSAEENARITSLRFNEGVGAGTDVIDAEVSLANARAALIDARADYAVAQNRLWLATGGDNALTR